ncbi:hypothetical protein CIB48_g125 [Xylaria polymorpha]|nr:hypothetical protein CIB48_g125 [Xylaria polymorpha]
MATTSGNHTRFSSSPDLSDPPSMLSGPTSPAGFGQPKPNGGELDEIVVDPTTIRYDVSGQPLLTKDGLPRRKPGPKPGSRIKRNSTNLEEAGDKPKRTRKPKDPNAPPTQRRRKTAGATDGENGDTPLRATGSPAGPSTTTPASRQPKITDMTTTLNRLEPIPQREPKRESMPGSMSNILNAEPELPQSYQQQQQQQQTQQQQSQQHPQPQPQPPPRPSVTPRASGTAYDPIRSSNYDPVRETMVSHSYSNTMGSPRGPNSTNAINRASASPSIASLFCAPPLPNPLSEEIFAPPPAPKQLTAELKKPAAPLSTLAASKIEIRPTSITTIGAAGAKRATSKNFSAASSSPRIHPAKDSLDPLSGRSILDFGRAEPGSELVVPSIILNIPLNGETNKYVNFMRMAEEQYGWEALHPRQAEHKARKARIAAASAALAQNDSSREGDEMSVDESDNEDSNVEMGGTSGPDKAADGKPAKKKRHFKEDEYDRDDDFVDDSELLWEEQAAASRDGFFVYSGPLVREVEKPEPGRYVETLRYHRTKLTRYSGDGLPKRGRGSRGGRGGSRGAATATGRGRGGGPGSRGGITRKPRMTKADRAQMDREKAEREANANLLKSSNTSTYNVLQPGSPKFADVAVHDTIAVLRKREAGSGKREEGGVPCMFTPIDSFFIMPTLHPLSAAALFDLKDWVVVVTGGGTGVGLMIAQTLAANGARVYITGRRADVLETSAHVHGSKDKLGENGGAILPLVMDVTNKESIKNAVSKFEAKERYLNVLVNNAGIFKSRPTASPADGPEAFGAAMFAEEVEDNWQETFLTNTTPLYFVTAAFLPLLAKAASSPAKQVGTVINNASASGLLRMTQRQQYSYNTSKAAALHLTRQMAFDLSHENINIRVNGLALGKLSLYTILRRFLSTFFSFLSTTPSSGQALISSCRLYVGYFPSEMTTGASNDENESSHDAEGFRGFMEMMGVKVVKRMGTARELASIVLTLATNEYIWGTVSIIDGGFALTLPGNM